MKGEPPSEAVYSPNELIENGFWAAYRYYLTSLGRFGSEGLHVFNVNNNILATFSFSDHQCAWPMKMSCMHACTCMCVWCNAPKADF